MSETTKLSLGYSNSYMFGIRSGWKAIRTWIKDEPGLAWVEDFRTCPECHGPLLQALVPAPFLLVVWKCKNGHKFYYQDTG